MAWSLGTVLHGKRQCLDDALQRNGRIDERHCEQRHDGERGMMVGMVFHIALTPVVILGLESVQTRVGVDTFAVPEWCMRLPARRSLHLALSEWCGGESRG